MSTKPMSKRNVFSKELVGYFIIMLMLILLNLDFMLMLILLNLNFILLFFEIWTNFEFSIYFL
jgi:hypothetical protein